ncbi:hypothetical protein B0H13DRAFT_2405321 [Mycena leptocephala]|nr:hypothetical protein B0H13DRAFT_2405321 [Mycena leptocephala]
MAATLPSVNRTLFEDGYEYNTEYADDMLEFTPPNSPSPKRGNMRGEPLTPIRRNDPANMSATLVNSEASQTPPEVRCAPDSTRGIVKFHHWTASMNQDQAMQEISCEYNKANDIYLQYLQFSLGGVAAPAISGTISPRAVFRTWSKGSPKPFWVKFYEHNGYVLRGVSRDFALGRVALLAQCQGNLAISNDLLAWAEKFNPNALTLPDADVSIIHVEAPEDAEPGSGVDSD